MTMTYNAPDVAFDKAIASGRLSADQAAPNYAGLFMYMGTRDSGVDTFKHIATRKYLAA